MNYLSPTLANALAHFKQLDPDTQPLWGSMNAIGMIEHLTDSLNLAQGKLSDVQLQIPEEKIPKALGFLMSDHPLPKNFKAPYGEADLDNRNTTIEDAIAEFETHWTAFEQHYEDHPEARNLHPSFGNLNKEEWLRMHSKHLTHHLQQFGLLPS